jgi:hypothetical protein
VRRIPTLSALSAIVAALSVSACSGTSTASEGMTADLERDLQLAATVRPARTRAVSAVELVANGGESGRNRGTRALVRTPRRAPTPSPAETTEEVAAPQSPADELAPLPAPTITETVNAPAPAPVVEPVATSEGSGPYVGSSPGTYSGIEEAERERGRGESSRGRGPGVIIRGGSAGDDNCQPRGRRGAGGIGMGGNIGTVIGIIGGISGGMGGGIAGGRRMPFPRR